MTTTNFVQMASERMAELRRKLLEAPKPATPVKPTKLTKQALKDLYASHLQSWWNSLPPAVRQHPWSMDTIMTAAFHGEAVATRFVSEQLRLAGWSEKRDWTTKGRNRRQWIPPVETK